MTAVASQVQIEDYLRRGLTKAGAAGAAATLVLDDRTQLFTHGLARPGKPVTPSTPFHVCSCSKTFTAAVFSRLVEDGTASWDNVVNEVVPEFELIDPWATRHCTFRDLVSMRVGLSRDGIAEWGIRQDIPKAVRLARARHMKLTSPFRSGFSYSNLCHIALSLAAERVADVPYPELVQNLVCQPLGMLDSCSAGFGECVTVDDAQPHLPVAGKTCAVRELTGPNSEGSARMHLSGRDAGRWMRFLLAALGGSDDGPLSAASVQAMAQPLAHIKDPDIRLSPHASSLCAYGMGLFITELHGRPLLRHAGGGRGWRHAMVLAPLEGVGIMLMASAESPVVEALALETLEMLTGRAPSDWTDAFVRTATSAATAERDDIESRFSADAQTPPRLPDAGTYAHPVTGKVQITTSDAGVRMTFADAPDFNALLEPLGGAAHALRFDEPALAPQPLDPPFRLRVAGTSPDMILETSHFGRLRRVTR